MLFPAATARADCIAMEKAAANIGANKCVSGRVVKVTHGERGTTYLNFCDDYRLCPFQIVVFAGDLRHVGDVRQLAGKTIEVHGEIKAYDGRPEIILRRIGQLKGGGAGLPPLPKDFDVEKKGRYSRENSAIPRSRVRARNTTSGKALRFRPKIRRRRKSSLNAFATIEPRLLLHQALL